MKLIDADALRRDVMALPNCYNGYSDTYDKSLIIGLIDEQIALDAVPVVRCENCVFFESGIRCGLRNEQADYNDFCSKGRRTDVD